MCGNKYSRTNQTLIFWLTVGLFLTLSACAKFEGEGGRAELSGRVLMNDIKVSDDNDTTLNAFYYAPEIRVYIIYGEGETFDDDTRTNYDGSYRFSFLQPGDYRVFAYTECGEPAEICPVFGEATIERRDRQVQLDDLVIYK